MNIRIMNKFVPALALAFAFASCSDISEDERYIAVETVAPVRSVLLEDFTGQNCVNCPSAHETIERLVEQYGASVIPVSIHAGGFGVSVDKTVFPNYIGLMTDDGNKLNDGYGIKEWPKGVVNGRGISNPGEWAALVRDELAKPSAAKIEIEAHYDASTNNVTITSTFLPTESFRADIHVWLLESGIVAFQRDVEKGRIPDYVHNNVFRASVTDIAGEGTDFKANIHTDKAYTIAVRDTEKEKWNPENLSVVVFLSDAGGVVQAAVADVTTDN